MRLTSDLGVQQCNAPWCVYPSYLPFVVEVLRYGGRLRPQYRAERDMKIAQPRSCGLNALVTV